MQFIFPQNNCSWAMQISCNEQLFNGLCNTSQIQKISKTPATAGKHTPNGKLISTLYALCLILSLFSFTPTKMASECSLCVSGCIRILKEPSGLQERKNAHEAWMPKLNCPEHNIFGVLSIILHLVCAEYKPPLISAALVNAKCLSRIPNQTWRKWKVAND